MSRRVTEQACWIGANGAASEETAQLIQSVLISLGDEGAITVSEEGGAPVEINSVSSRVLPMRKREAFMTLLETHTQGE